MKEHVESRVPRLRGAVHYIPLILAMVGTTNLPNSFHYYRVATATASVSKTSADVDIYREASDLGEMGSKGVPTGRKSNSCTKLKPDKRTLPFGVHS